LDGKILPLECLVLLATLFAAEEAEMSETKFLTPEEVAERYRGGISVGTLRNWRAMRIGPSFLKIGKAILYPVDELEVWDERNRVTCRASKRLNEQTDERA
jgi:hypothetical protein